MHYQPAAHEGAAGRSPQPGATNAISTLGLPLGKGPKFHLLATEIFSLWEKTKINQSNVVSIFLLRKMMSAKSVTLSQTDHWDHDSYWQIGTVGTLASQAQCLDAKLQYHRSYIVLLSSACSPGISPTFAAWILCLNFVSPTLTLWWPENLIVSRRLKQGSGQAISVAWLFGFQTGRAMLIPSHHNYGTLIALRRLVPYLPPEAISCLSLKTHL